MKKIIVLFSLFLVPSGALAQNTGASGYDINSLKPSRDGSGIIYSTGSDTLQWKELSLGTEFRWSRGILAAQNVNTGQVVRAISYFLISDFNLSAGLGRKMGVGIGIPLILRSGETNVPTQTAYSFTGVGDIDLELKLNILEEGKKIPGIAILPTITLPVGDVGKFTGFDDPTFWGRLAIDKKIGLVYLCLNTGYRIVSSKTVLAIPVDDQITVSVGASLALPYSWDLFGEMSGYIVPSNIARSNTPIIILGGVRKRFGGLSLNTGGGRGITDGAGASEVTIIGGANYAFKIKRREKKIEEALPAVEPPKLIATAVIYFAFSKDVFLRKWQKILDAIADDYRENPGSTIIFVGGHSDNEGENDLNTAISLRRAENVVKYLIEKGVAAENIKVEAYGESQPAADNRWAEGKSKNRRVEIHLYR